jgi:hypothetical protein
VLIAIVCFGEPTDPSSYTIGSKVWNINYSLGVTPVIHSIDYSHASYYVTAPPSGSGSVSNPSGITGRSPDGSVANIKGVAANAGGKIVTQLNQAAKGDIWIYANSVPGYNTDFYTFVSPTNNNDWTQTTSTTLQGNNKAVWINCGFYTKGNVNYFCIAALNDNGNAANINIDAVIIIPR